MYKPLTEQELSDAEERVRLGDPTVVAYLPRLLDEISEARRQFHALQPPAERHFNPLATGKRRSTLDRTGSLGSE